MRQALAVTIGIAVISVAVFIGVPWVNDSLTLNRALDTEVPAGQKFVPVAESQLYMAGARVILSRQVVNQRQGVVFDVWIESKVPVSLTGISVIAYLDNSLQDYLAAPLLVFGTIPGQELELEPHQKPYRHYIDRITTIPALDTLEADQADKLLDLLQQPIKIKVVSDQGIEYLEIPSDSIRVEWTDKPF